jgi:hypothetical protein
MKVEQVERLRGLRGSASCRKSSAQSNTWKQPISLEQAHRAGDRPVDRVREPRDLPRVD